MKKKRSTAGVEVVVPCLYTSYIILWCQFVQKPDHTVDFIPNLNKTTGNNNLSKHTTRKVHAFLYLDSILRKTFELFVDGNRNISILFKGISDMQEQLDLV